VNSRRYFFASGLFLALAGCAGSAAGVTPGINGSTAGVAPLSQSPQGLSTQQSHMKATYSSLHLFGRHSAEDGRHPEANLIDVKGTLYGTTSAGGTYDAGTVFSITPSGKEIVLHSFGATRDGANPMARLLNVNGGYESF
jgi:uncharacterized repeat protein (TIGR03803 family)